MRKCPELLDLPRMCCAPNLYLLDRPGPTWRRVTNRYTSRARRDTHLEKLDVARSGRSEQVSLAAHSTYLLDDLDVGRLQVRRASGLTCPSLVEHRATWANPAHTWSKLIRSTPEHDLGPSLIEAGPSLVEPARSWSKPSQLWWKSAQLWSVRARSRNSNMGPRTNQSGPQHLPLVVVCDVRNCARTAPLSRGGLPSKTAFWPTTSGGAYTALPCIPPSEDGQPGGGNAQCTASPSAFEQSVDESAQKW